MSKEHGVAKSGDISRHVTRDKDTGASQRYSQSAGGMVDNGNRSSLKEATDAGARDIDRGPRSPGDFSKRP